MLLSPLGFFSFSLLTGIFNVQPDLSPFLSCPEHMDQDFSAVDIHDGQHQRVPAGTMHVDIFYVHRQVLQGPLSLQAPELDKIALGR